MPNKTANYNLIKPLGSEHYDINVHNGNMDIIDEELKKVTESNNKRIDEIKSELNDSSLEVFKTEGQTTKLDGCTGGFVSIDKIEGRTLVNLFKFTNVETSPRGTYTLYITNDINNMTIGKSLTIVNNTFRKLVYAVYDSISGAWIREVPINQGATYITLANNERISGVYSSNDLGWTEQNKNDMLKVMAFEGDWTNKPIPSYFEGIKSVGEPIAVGNNLSKTFEAVPNMPNLKRFSYTVTPNTDYILKIPKLDIEYCVAENETKDIINYFDARMNTKGYVIFNSKSLNTIWIYARATNGTINFPTGFDNVELKECAYRIEILSETESENLLDIYSKVETTPLVPIPVEFKCKAQGDKLYIYTGTSNYHGYGFKRWLNKGDYYISSKNLTPTKSVYVILNSDKGVNIQLKNAEQANLNIPYDGWYYVCFDIAGDSSLIDPAILTDIMLTKGVDKKDYKPYKGDKTENLTTQPLRKWDSIDANGVVTRSSCEISLDNNGDWQSVPSYAPNGYSVFTMNLKIPYKYISQYDGSNFINNLLKNQTWISMYNQKVSEESITIGDNSYVYIKILNSQLTSPDVTGFKAWLAQRQGKLAYQLATPTIENLNKTLTLRAYDNLIVNSGCIQPEVTYSYSKNIGERFVTIEETVNGVKGTVENINKNFEEKIKEINLKTGNIRVPVIKVNGKEGDIVLSANDIKNSEGKTLETKSIELTNVIKDISNIDKEIVNLKSSLNTINSTLNNLQSSLNSTNNIISTMQNTIWIGQ